MQNCLAHVNRENGRIQTLKEHAENVAYLCGRFAAPLHLEKTAYLIGLLHDMGKATTAFQDYLHSEGKRSPHYHAPAGAIYAYERWFAGNVSQDRQITAQTIALCIYGHHTGLMDCVDSEFTLHFQKQMQQDKRVLHYDAAVVYFTENVTAAGELDKLFDAACTEIECFSSLPKNKAFYNGLTVRLLLSMLVDADRYDTACFEFAEDALRQPPAPEWGKLLAQLNMYTEASFTACTPIGQSRAQIARLCADASARVPGVYRLTVPTGGGKTLSSLRFALGHASLHGMERIFYVIPFNTILDQNARDIRKALGGYDGILEHHANVVIDDEDERVQYRRLTERWDSRIILTSMVQYLNALYRCENTNARRMHNLTRSVVIFDEIQALPRSCKVLFERAVNFLVYCCGCTVLLCSATQMELGGITMSPDSELMGDATTLSKLYDDFSRVHWIPDLDLPLTNEAAAAKLCGLLDSHGGVLAIVNTRAVAWDVFNQAVSLLKERNLRPIEVDCTLNEDAVTQLARNSTEEEVLCIHLSTQLCPRHRLAYIDFMKAWLYGGGRVLCVSTALIEAGINISFPAVVRSLVSIPSIVQAGGRCNRNMERETGDVFIWEFGEERLKHLPEIDNGKSCTRSLAREYEGDFDWLCKPEGIQKYFEKEYEYTKEKEKYCCKHGNLVDLFGVNRAFSNGTKDLYPLKQAFHTAGSIFQVIDENTRAVIVPYGDGKTIINELLSASDMKRRSLLLTRAQQFSVNVYTEMMDRLEKEDAVFPVGDTGAIALKSEYYDAERGLNLKGREMDAMIL